MKKKPLAASYAVGNCLYLDKKMPLIILICLSAIGGCSYINKKLGLKNDNLIESLGEDVIESHTGLSIDLTPEDSDDDDYSLDVWRKD